MNKTNSKHIIFTLFIASIPTSYLINVYGNIVYKHIGGMNIDQIKEYIKTLDK